MQARKFVHVNQTTDENIIIQNSILFVLFDMPLADMLVLIVILLQINLPHHLTILPNMKHKLHPMVFVIDVPFGVLSFMLVVQGLAGF